MRGRVMAIRLAIALGGTPIGAPIVGWVADHYGPRWSLGLAAASGIAAALIGTYARQLRRVRTVDRSEAGATPSEQSREESSPAGV
jgi:MFS family permease